MRRARFELAKAKPADLQSALVDHLSTDAYICLFYLKFKTNYKIKSTIKFYLLQFKVFYFVDYKLKNMFWEEINKKYLSTFFEKNKLKKIKRMYN